MTTRACGTRARVWHDIFAFTTENGSIKRWAIGRQQPCTWPKGSAIFIMDSLAQARTGHSDVFTPNLCCPKNGLDRYTYRAS